MKKIFIIKHNFLNALFFATLLFAAIFLTFATHKQNTFAEEVYETNYVVFDEFNNFLFERISVEVGDIYIDKNFNKFEIYLVDSSAKQARAKFVEKVERPKVSKRSQHAIDTSTNKKIGLYMTHNAESYILGDGYDSVYGKGGIHDVSKALLTAFEKRGVSVLLDETLHLPHDSLAYSRSKNTAQALLAKKPDAIFDIHRDGVSRRTYAKVTNGKEHSTVRIVVGQANPYQERNLAFATYLLSVAETKYPWLFLDIYFAKGHYNQNLYEKALLFEMGTYTIEKHLVMETVEPLVDIIFTTLYSTAVTEDGDLVIGDNQGGKLETVNESLSKGVNRFPVESFVSAGAVITLTFIAVYLLIKWRKKVLTDKK